MVGQNGMERQMVDQHGMGEIVVYLMVMVDQMGMQVAVMEDQRVLDTQHGQPVASQPGRIPMEMETRLCQPGTFREITIKAIKVPLPGHKLHNKHGCQRSKVMLPPPLYLLHYPLSESPMPKMVI